MRIYSIKLIVDHKNDVKKNVNVNCRSQIQEITTSRTPCLKMLKSLTFLRTSGVSRSLRAFKHTIDYSRVPKITEFDLNEKFVRGTGPGGSAVNKNSNCVVLTHMPTGITVKCHVSRCQDENRKIAREMLIAKLDEKINGENCIAAQKKRIEENKFKRNENKKKKLAQLKFEWKKREGLL